jgi:hypothetical protein
MAVSKPDQFLSSSTSPPCLFFIDQYGFGPGVAFLYLFDRKMSEMVFPHPS